MALYKHSFLTCFYEESTKQAPLDSHLPALSQCIRPTQWLLERWWKRMTTWRTCGHFMGSAVDLKYSHVQRLDTWPHPKLSNSLTKPSCSWNLRTKLCNFLEMRKWGLHMGSAQQQEGRILPRNLAISSPKSRRSSWRNPWTKLVFTGVEKTTKWNYKLIR